MHLRARAADPHHRKRWRGPADGHRGLCGAKGRDVCRGRIRRGSKEDHRGDGLGIRLLRQLDDPRWLGNDDGGAAQEPNVGITQGSECTDLGYNIRGCRV